MEVAMGRRLDWSRTSWENRYFVTTTTSEIGFDEAADDIAWFERHEARRRRALIKHFEDYLRAQRASLRPHDDNDLKVIRSAQNSLSDLKQGRRITAGKRA
jgi:hypothetical protein